MSATKRYPVEILTGKEVAALMRTCSHTAPTGVRNRALIAMIYRAGLRISEALALDPKDVDVEAGTIRVLHGKGDRSRVVGMDSGGFQELERWINRRRLLGFNGRHPLFCTLAGKRVSADYVRQALPRMAKRAGIEKRVHAHGLRHTHACQLREEGVDVGIISKQLGHASIAVTAIYLDHITPAQVIETIRSRTWDTPDASREARRGRKTQSECGG